MSDEGMAPPGLDDDPRWPRLRERTWVCLSCGETHAGLFDLVTSAPYYWPPGEPAIGNADIAGRHHYLASDFCILNGEHYFIRCVLPFLVLGTGGVSFSFGVWSTASAATFALYVKGFDDDGNALDPWLGWLSNRLPFYPDTLSLKCRVHPRAGSQRPWIELQPTDHPMSLDQQNGMTLDRVFDIYAASGHDLRSALEL